MSTHFSSSATSKKSLAYPSRTQARTTHSPPERYPVDKTHFLGSRVIFSSWVPTHGKTAPIRRKLTNRLSPSASDHYIPGPMCSAVHPIPRVDYLAESVRTKTKSGFYALRMDFCDALRYVGRGGSIGGPCRI